ncbi:MAG: type II toxin-antitoxin system VapC family toxin [Sphingomonadales bacterium]|nr:type II toxin-antitoxin system VapC family toxin [Sphingomonadales bacterium]
MIVVDASLAAKWILWEDQSDAALRFLSLHCADLCAPDLIVIEVAGAIARVARMAGIDDADSGYLLDRWLGDFGSASVDARKADRSLLRTAARLSLDLSHPIQDCLYLAMAIDLGVDLATCDAKFARRATAIYPNVRLLADYDLTAAR